MSFCVTHCTHYTWSCKDRDTYWNTVITSIIIIGIQPLGRFGQRTGLSHATSMTLVRCILGKFLGVVWHCFPPRLEVPTFATTRDILAAELWARMLSGNFAEMTPFRDLLHSANLRHGTEGRRAEDFFALKNPTVSAGFEPANMVTKGQNATARPPKQHDD